MLFGELNQFVDRGKGQTGYGIRAAVVDGNASGILIRERGAGEDDIGHIADAFVEFPRSHEVVPGTILDLPRFIQIQKGGTDTIDIAVAGGEHTMVNQQPAFVGFNRRRSRTDLGALPGGIVALDGAENEAVASPELQILGLAQVDIAKGRVAVIRRPGEHHIHAVDFAGEEHAVAVEGQEGVLQLMEDLEIFRPGSADGRAVIAVAPGDVILSFQHGDAGIVAVFLLQDFRVRAFKDDRVILDLPVIAILGETGEQVHADGAAVTAENAGKPVAEGNDCTVEDAVGTLVSVAADDGVSAETPDRFCAGLWFVFPGNIRERSTGENVHNDASFPDEHIF